MKSPNPKVEPRKVLIVDDDYYFRLALEKSLKQSFYNCTTAESIKHALELLGLEQFDLVISDINFPESSGLELLRWTLENRPVPVVLMTGFTDLIETQEASAMGAAGFLTKPFKREDLIQVLETSLKPASQDKDVGGFTNPEDEYCKLNIEDFISGKEIKYDIFVRLSAEKFVKIAHTGADITADQIRNYRGKGIQHLYLRKDDFRRYLNFNLSITRAVTQSERISRGKKLNFLKHTAEVVLASSFTNDLDKDALSESKLVIDMSLTLLGDDEDALNVLELLHTHTDFLYAHSVGVSLYSTLIGKKIGWKSPSTIYKLSMAGLLHDIGKKEIPRDILNKPRKLLTADEVILLESHATRGAEILAKIPSVPSDIIHVVHQHHENCVGLGYPFRLKHGRIHPLARVVALADEFCNHVIPNPNSTGMASPEAIRKITDFREDYFDPVALVALMQLFKMQPPAELLEAAQRAQAST